MAARTLSTVDPRVLEGTAVLATAIGHLSWGLLDLPRAPFVFAAVGGWAAYVGWRASQDWGVLREWGFRRDNFCEAWRPAVALGVPVALSMLSVPSQRLAIVIAASATLFGLQYYAVLGRDPLVGFFPGP